MVYIIPKKERERFEQHGILFLPLKRILNQDLELEELFNLSGDDNLFLWGKGGFQKRQILLSSLKQNLPFNALKVESVGMLNFEELSEFQKWNTSVNHFNYGPPLGIVNVGYTSVKICRSFR